jgi:flagellar biosynthetic protein FlhB
MAGDKTEKASPKRREEARKKGQVARSTEISTAGALFAALAALTIVGPRLVQGFEQVLREGLEQAWNPANAEDAGLAAIARWGMHSFWTLTAPVALSVLVFTLVLGAAQTRLRFAPAALKPSFKKLNPGPGLKRIVGPQGLVEAIKGLLKTGIVGLVAFLSLWPELPRLGAMVGLPAGEILVVVAHMVSHIAIRAVIAFSLIAAVDYLWQRRRLDKQLRMTKDEVKRESRQADVAPEIRSQIRKRQFEMARRRMLADVPTADVVVTNPTHFAVALRYDGRTPAPEVIARGADHVAAAIRAVAEENGVPIVENPPLARALYRDVEVGSQIPEMFFQAVAEVLAFVYRTSGRRRTR